MRKIVLFAILGIVAISTIVGCESEAWKESNRRAHGTIYVGDVVYLSGRPDLMVANPEPVKSHDEVFPPRGSCRTSFGSTLTVVEKYPVAGVKNLLLRYSPPENESCVICCPEGTLTSIRERDWQELRKTSDDMRERWLLEKLEPEAEKEAVKKYLESQKGAKK